MAKINIENVQEEVKNLIAEIVEIEPEKIEPEARFVEDLGMDSMMALEILASVEKKYSIKIPEENLMKMNNLKQIIELIAQFLDEK